MKKPSDSEDLSFEADPSNDTVMALQEDENAEAETYSYSGLVSYIEGKFQKSKDNRLSDETRWLTAYKNYRGVYSTDVQFTDTEKSRAFIKLSLIHISEPTRLRRSRMPSSA